MVNSFQRHWKKVLLFTALILPTMIFFQTVYTYVTCFIVESEGCMVRTHFKNERGFRRFAEALNQYYLEKNAFPTTSYELATMFRKIDPSITSVDDEWGAPHRYESDGQSYVVVSSGPDGTFGTKDDLRIEGRAHSQATQRSSASRP